MPRPPATPADEGFRAAQTRAPVLAQLPAKALLGLPIGWPREIGWSRVEVGVDQDGKGQMIDALRLQGRNVLVERMGIEIVEASPERVVGTMPVQGNTQPYGILHGGASCVLAESLGSLGAALQAGPDRFTVGIEINATHHRSASAGLHDIALVVVGHFGNDIRRTCQSLVVGIPIAVGIPPIAAASPPAAVGIGAPERP